MTKGSSRLRHPSSYTSPTIALTGMLVGAPAANAAIEPIEPGRWPHAHPARERVGLLGVTVSNAQFVGANTAAGTFSGGGTGAGATIGFDTGVVLSSGAISSVPGPNTLDDVTTANLQPGDATLDALLDVPCEPEERGHGRLDVRLRPGCVERLVQVRVLLGRVQRVRRASFNDVFGFFVNGTNCATVGGQPVSVDTINGGNPFGTGASNPSLYRNNPRTTRGRPRSTRRWMG